MSSGATRTAQGTRAAPPPDLRARLQGLAPFDGKLHVPPVRPGIVARSGLVDRVRTGAPVLVISAPAGYGKTTLLSQWAAVEERPFAWLTLTPGDNDLTVLVAYLVRALDAVDPLPTATLAGLAAAGADGQTVLLPRLGRALLERPDPFVLALDDVHVLTDPECRSALGVLAAHLPDGSQLVLASRQDPPLARARLRAGRTLTEIRLEDLVLTTEESATALRDAGLALDDATVDALVEQTEGWAAGIYLAALAVRDLDDAAAAARRFTGDNKLVADYLRDELIDGLPDDVLEFLTRTSVLELLDGPGCDAVLERTGSREVLEELAGSNLFVVPLDAAGEQYRYHHLFSDLLRVELRRREPELEAELHGRASALFEARGLLGLAVEHARLGGDVAPRGCTDVGGRSGVPRHGTRGHARALVGAVHPGGLPRAPGAGDRRRVVWRQHPEPIHPADQRMDRHRAHGPVRGAAARRHARCRGRGSARGGRGGARAGARSDVGSRRGRGRPCGQLLPPHGHVPRRERAADPRASRSRAGPARGGGEQRVRRARNRIHGPRAAGVAGRGIGLVG